MTISQMNFIEQSAFFATLSNYAYKDINVFQQQFPSYSVQYVSNNGADAYILENTHDFIVVCRGTEVKQFSDIRADLGIARTKMNNVKVHIGFNHYVDHIWDDILARGRHACWHNKSVWLTGHSLGAAMATIIAYRFALHTALSTPTALFTYGSPRVGNKAFVDVTNALSYPHHRWVNDGDIITKIPFAPWFYHSGTMHHIDADGYVTPFYERCSWSKYLLNLIKSHGLLRMLYQDAQDHSSDLYKNYLNLAEKFPILYND